MILCVGDSYTAEELSEYMVSLGFGFENDYLGYTFTKDRLYISIFMVNDSITKMYVWV